MILELGSMVKLGTMSVAVVFGEHHQGVERRTRVRCDIPRIVACLSRSLYMAVYRIPFICQRIIYI